MTREGNRTHVGKRTNSSVVDSGESIRFSFASPEVTDVILSLGFLNALATAEIEAFELGGASLGTIAIDAVLPPSIDVSALFGNLFMESVTLTAPLSTLRIGAISFTPIPEPSAALLFAAGLWRCG